MGSATTAVWRGRGSGSLERRENGILVGLFQCALLVHGQCKIGTSSRESPCGGEVRAIVLDGGVAAVWRGKSPSGTVVSYGGT
jgi:hypothetical protein